MKRIIVLGIVLAVGGLVGASAHAGIISASGVISDVPDGSDFDYTIKLTNTSGAGNDSIGTFWVGWVPGMDFMPTSPISVTPPSGWTDKVTNGGSTDGFAIQFVAGTNDQLAPGSSLLFSFKSADTPAELMGNSPFHPTFPALTSFVYEGAPFVGDSQQFTVSFQSVPEPSSLLLGAVAAVGSLGYRRLRRRAKV
jgi:hypothetical protein